MHYRYITDEYVNVAGVHPKTQGSEFWQNHYKQMCGSTPTEIKTNVMQPPPRNKRNATFTLSYSGMVRDDTATEIDMTMGEDSTMTNMTSNQTP
jgi:hypothetical protein